MPANRSSDMGACGLAGGRGGGGGGGGGADGGGGICIGEDAPVLGYGGDGGIEDMSEAAGDGGAGSRL